MSPKELSEYYTTSEAGKTLLSQESAGDSAPFRGLTKYSVAYINSLRYILKRDIQVMKTDPTDLAVRVFFSDPQLVCLKACRMLEWQNICDLHDCVVCCLGCASEMDLIAAPPAALLKSGLALLLSQTCVRLPPTFVIIIIPRSPCIRCLSTGATSLSLQRRIVQCVVMSLLAGSLFWNMSTSDVAAQSSRVASFFLHGIMILNGQARAILLLLLHSSNAHTVVVGV